MKRRAIQWLAAVCVSTGAVAQSTQELIQEPGQALSQGKDPYTHDHDHDIEHVLVTMPLHKASMETAFPIDSLTGDELAREAAATLGDTLESLPGIHNASFGPGVGQPVIRGLSGPRVMTLQNGTRSADVSSLSGDHAVAVEPLLADSIEVLRGPASLLYGGGAIGGVVNVVDGRIPTRRIEETEVGAAWRYTGANNGQSAVLRIDTGLGDFGFHGDWLVREADPLKVPDGSGSDGGDVLENTGARATSGTLGTSYQFQGGFVGFAVNWQDSNYGLPEGTHAHGVEDDHVDSDEDHDETLDGDHEGENIRLDMEQTRYDLALHLHEPLPGVDTFRGFVSVTEYQHAELEGADIGTVYSSDTAELRLELLHTEVAGFHGVMGLQASDSSFSAVGDESFVPETDIQRLGVFVLEDWHGGSWQLEAGLRFDSDTLEPVTDGIPRQDFSAVSGSLGVIYEITPEWHVSTSVSRAERAPAVEELYSNYGNDGPDTWVTHAATGAIELGNIDLDTESGINVDLGITMHHGAHSANLALYVNDFDSFINLANTGLDVDGTPVRKYQQQGARFIGAEFEGDWMLAPLASGDLFLETGLDVVRGELDRGGDIPRLPPLTAKVGLNWTDGQGMYFTRLTAAAKQDRPGDNEEPTDGWLRWDVGAEWRLSSLGGLTTISASVRNITDEEIRLSTSWLREVAPEPGRSFDLGFRIEL